MSQTNGILERELVSHRTRKIILKFIKVLSLKNNNNGSGQCAW